MKYYITLIILALCGGFAHSQEISTEICFDFRAYSAIIDSNYSDNAARMQEFVNTLNTIRKDNSIRILEVSFCGAASPEGSYQLNKKLAQGRLTSLENYIRKEVDIPDSIITRNDSYIAWDYLKSQIKQTDLEYKEEVIAILEERAELIDYYSDLDIDSRIVKLKALDEGKVWDRLRELYFDQMRNACAVIVLYQKLDPIVQEPKMSPLAMHVEPRSAFEIVKFDSTPAPVEPKQEDWCRKLHLKSNVLGLGLAIANVAAEIDIAKHWSFTLPVYYSAWDYFKSTIKFRTFAVQPEFRYWISKKNDGVFTGAHIGLAYYNLALNRDYRRQDHSRETPALGGGLSVGYRMPISKNDRWRVEFSLGAGVYSLHYDKFHNTPNTKDGLLIESIKKTYWGLDQAAVSFSYSFDIKKKGDKR